MTTTDPLSNISTRSTPQNMQADPRQERQAGGGFTFVADDLTRVRRFLATGTEGGTFYAGEREHTVENAETVLRAVRAQGPEVLDIVRTASLGGHTVKQHPLMFTLAALVSHAEEETKRAALASIPDVCRTGTHLFLFARYVEQFRGWGRGLRKGVARWYADQEIDDLAYQAAKYPSREGFTHRDLMRLAHPEPHVLADTVKRLLSQPQADDWVLTEDPEYVEAKAIDDERKRLFDHLAGRPQDIDALPGALRVKTRLHGAAHIDTVLGIIAEERRVSWEMVPSEWLGDKRTWEALLDNGHVPLGALLRNLPRLTNLGVIDPIGVDDRTSRIIGRLIDAEALTKARVHPMSVMLAAATYKSGRSQRGDSTWRPVKGINKALDAAFPKAFGSLVPIPDRRAVIAVDTSQSMDTNSVAGLPGLSCRDAACALAQVLAAQFPRNMGLAFSGPDLGTPGRGFRDGRDQVVPFDVDPDRRLTDVIAEAKTFPFGSTDCSLPVLHAMERGLAVDAFVVLTDNETWAGKMHPHQALVQYRQRTGIPARMVTVSMQANRATIADPSDPLMLDVVGLDSSSIGLVTDFIAGRV